MKEPHPRAEARSVDVPGDPTRQPARSAHREREVRVRQHPPSIDHDQVRLPPTRPRQQHRLLQERRVVARPLDRLRHGGLPVQVSAGAMAMRPSDDAPGSRPSDWLQTDAVARDQYRWVCSCRSARQAPAGHHEDKFACRPAGQAASSEPSPARYTQRPLWRCPSQRVSLLTPAGRAYPFTGSADERAFPEAQGFEPGPWPVGLRSHPAPQRQTSRRWPSSVVPVFTHRCLPRRHSSGFLIASPPKRAPSPRARKRRTAGLPH